MTKAHEETWGDDYEVTVVGPRLERHEDIEREVLARAAPEMARALLDLLDDDGHLERCFGADGSGCIERCGQIRSALTKAGVLP